MSESKLTYKGKIYQLYDAFPDKREAIALAEQIGSEPGKKVVIKDLGQTRLKWGVYIYEKYTRTYVPIIRDNPKRRKFKNPGLFRKGDAWKFKMTNLPGNPWHTYYVYSVERNGQIIFSSIPPGHIQAQAEHFRLFESEFKKDIKAGLMKKISKNPTLAVFNPPIRRKTVYGSWYVGKVGRTHVEIFNSVKTPTRKSHGQRYGLVTGPFKTKEKAEEHAQHFGYKYIYHKNPPDVLSNEVLEMAYVHAEDGKAYKHDFEKSGTRAVLNKDGSVSLRNKNHKLWRDF